MSKVEEVVVIREIGVVAVGSGDNVIRLYRIK